MVSVNSVRQFRVFAVDVAGVERRDVRLGKLGTLRELCLEPGDRLVALAAEEPIHEAQCPHVLAAVSVFGTEAHILHRFERHLGDVERQHAIAIEGSVLERIGFVSGFLEVVGCECAGIDD